MRRTLSIIALTALAAGALVGGLTTPAAAGGNLIVSLASPQEPLTFDVTLTIGDCNTGTFSIDAVTANGNPVTPISVTEDPSNPNHGVLVLPSDTEPGNIAVDASCIDGTTPVAGDGGVSWAALAVTKAVVGEVPAGTTFQVHVGCVGGLPGVRAGESDFTAQDVPPNFAVDLSYGAGGGVHYVYTDGPVACLITEPGNGGALSTTITPQLVLIPSPSAFAATVTNTFPELVVAFTG